MSPRLRSRHFCWVFSPERWLSEQNEQTVPLISQVSRGQEMCMLAFVLIADGPGYDLEELQTTECVCTNKYEPQSYPSSPPRTNRHLWLTHADISKCR